MSGVLTPLNVSAKFSSPLLFGLCLSHHPWRRLRPGMATSENGKPDVSLLYFVRSESTDDTYELKAMSKNGTVSFSCTCLGAQNGAACKHRLNLIYGDLTNLIADGPNDVGLLKPLFAGTGIERSINALADLEQELAILKRRITSQKKAIAREMFGAS